MLYMKKQKNAASNMIYNNLFMLVTVITTKAHHLMGFSFKLPGVTFVAIVGWRHSWIFEEEDVLFR